MTHIGLQAFAAATTLNIVSALLSDVFVSLFFFFLKENKGELFSRICQVQACLKNLLSSARMLALFSLPHKSLAVGERHHLEGVHETIHALHHAALLSSGQRCSWPLNAFPKAIYRYLAQHLLDVGQSDLLTHIPKSLGAVLGLIVFHASHYLRTLLSVLCPCLPFLRARGSYSSEFLYTFFCSQKLLNYCVFLFRNECSGEQA